MRGPRQSRARAGCLAAFVGSLPDHNQTALGFDYMPDLLGALSELLLKSANELLILSLGIFQIVIG
jgi:hypothetical protein